jgi:hypothetical protein
LISKEKIKKLLNEVKELKENTVIEMKQRLTEIENRNLLLQIKNTELEDRIKLMEIKQIIK